MSLGPRTLLVEDAHPSATQPHAALFRASDFDLVALMRDDRSGAVHDDETTTILPRGVFRRPDDLPHGSLVVAEPGARLRMTDQGAFGACRGTRSR